MYAESSSFAATTRHTGRRLVSWLLLSVLQGLVVSLAIAHPEAFDLGSGWGGVARALIASAGCIVVRLAVRRAWLHRRRGVYCHELDARTLRDIGLSRHDLGLAAEPPRRWE